MVIFLQRVMTRPAGQVRRYFKSPRVESGRGQEVFEISRVETCRVWRFTQNITGRVGSPDTIPPARKDPTREEPTILFFFLLKSQRGKREKKRKKSALIDPDRVLHNFSELMVRTDNRFVTKKSWTNGRKIHHYWGICT